MRISSGDKMESGFTVSSMLAASSYAMQLADSHEGALDAIDGVGGDFASADGGAIHGADNPDDRVDGARCVVLLAQPVAELFDGADADLVEAESADLRHDVFVETAADVGNAGGRLSVLESYQSSAACAKVGSFLSSRYSPRSTFTTVSERCFSAAFFVGK